MASGVTIPAEDITTASSTATHTTGIQTERDGKLYEYVRLLNAANACTYQYSVAAYHYTGISSLHETCVTTDVSCAAGNTVAGVLAVKLTHAQYGWIQKTGLTACRAGTTCVAGASMIFNNDNCASGVAAGEEHMVFAIGVAAATSGQYSRSVMLKNLL